MNDLARHIEALLVDNDCVIVPGVGGFIIHYTPSVWMEEEQAFLPPTRMTGFNSRLKVNDGLLVQSYMSAHHTDFAKASKLMEKDVEALLSTLHSEGKVILENIGELKLSVRNMLEFTPYTGKLCTPALYGWSRFEMHRLKAAPITVHTPSVQPKTEKREIPRFKVRINAPFWSNVAAVAAIIILCFALSIPVENTEVVKGNYAQLLPTDAFRQMGQQSLAMTPLAVKKPAPATVESKKPQVTPPQAEDGQEVVTHKPASSKPAPQKAAPKVKERSKVAKTTATSPRIYHIIVASVGSTRDAKTMAESLVAKGFKNAKAIIGDGKMRVCIDSYPSEAEAYRALNQYRKEDIYKNAWILKKR